MLERKECREQVLLIVEKVIGRKLQPIEMSASFNSIGIDSLDVLSIIVSCEETFKIEIEDHISSRLNYIDDIVNFITYIA